MPVNPRNYRNYRRDDLKVSIAGVTMNLIMFALGNLLLLILLIAAMRHDGALSGTYLQLLVARYDYYSVALYLIEESFGTVAGYLSQMLYYFIVTNIALCVFNLLPVPPLDGSHVLNDLLLRRRRLFANPQTARIASSALFVLAMTGVLGRGLGWVDNQILTGAGSLAVAALRGVGLLP